MVETFRNVFSFESWFDSWCQQLGSQDGEPSDERWVFSLRRTILEALSDASSEQFLNPLVASHLRHFGRRLADQHVKERWFWVRSEWTKVDLSYGLAENFDIHRHGAWDRQWATGGTGDLGQCEVKVCYAHLYADKIETLAAQLVERRARDRRGHAPDAEKQTYHGVIWLFEHGDANEIRRVGAHLEDEARRWGLAVRRPFQHSDELDDLGTLWPHPDGYRCRLAIALVELANE